MDDHRKESNRKKQRDYRERQRQLGNSPVYVTPRQKELLPKIEALFEENQELKARNQDLETQIKQLETEAQELKKPWWKRFFRKREQ